MFERLGLLVLSMLAWVGGVALFGFRALYEAVLPPYELKETWLHTYEIGWRSLPLIALYCRAARGGRRAGIVRQYIVSKYEVPPQNTVSSGLVTRRRMVPERERWDGISLTLFLDKEELRLVNAESR